MSYSTIYDFVCVETSRGVIPIVLTGSKTCIAGERQKEHVLRTWSLWSDDMLDVKKGVLLSIIQREMSVFDPKSQLYARNGKPLYSYDVCNMFLNACKKARRIEDICAANYAGNLSCSIRVAESHFGTKVSEAVSIDNTRDLEAWIDFARSEYEKLKLGGFFPLYSIQFNSGGRPLKKPSELNGPVILKMGRNRYVCGCTATSLSFTGDIEKAIVFENAQVAKKMVNPAFYQEEIRPVSVSAIDRHAKNNVIIKITDGYGKDYYIFQLTAKSLRRTPRPKEAKRFPSERAALAWIKDHRIAERFQCGRNLAVETLA